MQRPLRPFLVAAAIGFVVVVAMIQLPHSFVAQLERNRPLNTPQSGWAYRLMAVAAIAQAAYGGFVVLQPERIRRARERDAKSGAMTRSEIASAVGRTAAAMTLLTLVYALAAFAITGERGGFWLFVLVFVAQGAWYYRQVGEITDWLRFQPEKMVLDAIKAPWTGGPADYCPPLARGLAPLPQRESTEAAGDA